MANRKSLLFDEGTNDALTVKINDAYARRFGEKKAREERAHLEEKFKKSNDSASTSSDSELEDEDGALLTPSVDAQILKTLAVIRSKSDVIYDPSTRFYDEEAIRKAEEEWLKKVKQPSMSIKDYQREQLLKGGVDEDEQAAAVSFEQEQSNLKEALLQAAAVDADGDFLKIRARTDEEIQREDEAYKAFLLENLAHSQDASRSMQDWLQYKDDKLSKEDAFLVDYILNRGWIDKEKKRVLSYDKIVAEDDEDEKVVENTDEFEAKYNFRFEQPAAETVHSFPRRITESIRAEDTRRREARAARKLRKEQEKLQRKEELKRLKNLRKQEIRQQLRTLRKVSGRSDLPEGILDSDGSDFDLAAHDAKMATIFNDDYFQENDQEKPVFSDAEEAAPDAIVTPVVANATKAIRKRLNAKDAKRGKGAPFDGLLKLDYEDKIGDTACRFKYCSVPATTFGLDPAEILAADDGELNAFVSLKKLAPYIPIDKQRESIRKYSDKRRVYQFRKNARTLSKKHGKK